MYKVIDLKINKNFCFTYDSVRTALVYLFIVNYQRKEATKETQVKSQKEWGVWEH